MESFDQSTRTSPVQIQQVIFIQSILSAHIKLFENNYSGTWYFFAGPVFMTKVSQRGVRQYYFCTSAWRRWVSSPRWSTGRGWSLLRAACHNDVETPGLPRPPLLLKTGAGLLPPQNTSAPAASVTRPHGSPSMWFRLLHCQAADSHLPIAAAVRLC